MGNVRFGIPEDLVCAIQGRSGLRYAIETGTYEGDSTRFLGSLFERVWSIESDARLYSKTWDRLIVREQVTNVTLLLGSSSEKLGRVLLEVDSPALFWLDSHWFERLEVTAALQCPLLEELRTIAGWQHADRSYLLIDDAAAFQSLPTDPNYRRNEWPTLANVLATLDAKFPTHHVYTVEDVIVAEPKEIFG